MKVEDFFNYQEDLVDSGVFLTFSGVLTHDFMLKLGDMLKTKMALQNVDKNLMLKVFSLMIEQSQNIIFYSSEKLAIPSLENEEMGIGTVAVGFKDDHYFVFCGNHIANPKVGQLSAKLEAIQKMSPEELKQHYKEQRRLEPDTDSKGAGLGFIEMARKSSQPIEFAFRKIDDNQSYFTLKTII
ncbi:MAG: hypothetical protein EPO42_01780 [Gallionellaceae bacterium]|nr:MAG: hypothetical protein EPO42_01780 [Gallionellaceae bacterium]